jgi:inorganic pyrophosphatase
MEFSKLSESMRPGFFDPQKFIGKTLSIKIDRPLGSFHPEWGFIYPVNYGYLPGITAPDGDNLDAYVLGVFNPLEEFCGCCIGVIHRLDDKDDKLIVVPEGKSYSEDQIRALTEFQERFFKSVILLKNTSRENFGSKVEG